MDNLYVKVLWPDSQEYMNLPDAELGGESAYFVPVNSYKKRLLELQDASSG